MRRAAPAVQEAAEHTKLWWAADAAMATLGGWRGRTAAAAGVAAMTTAQVLSNAVAKPLYRRRRPPAAGAACGVLAAVVAGERMHSGAHCPSDVAAGAVIGPAAAALVRAAPRLPWRRVL